MVRALADFYEKTAALFKRQFAFLQAIILLSVLLAVANSVNMTIFERTGEFGTLMAVGTRRMPIFRLVILENLVVGPRRQRARRDARHPRSPGSSTRCTSRCRRRPTPTAVTTRASARCGDAGAVLVRLVGFLATPLTALWPAFRICAGAGRHPMRCG